MKQVAEFEMEWRHIGRGGSPTTSLVRVEYIPYAPTEQYKLKYPRASVLSVKGWKPDIKVPKSIKPKYLNGSKRSNFVRFRNLFREVTGYRGKGLLEAVQADFEAQLNGRYRL